MEGRELSKCRVSFCGNRLIFNIEAWRSIFDEGRYKYAYIVYLPETNSVGVTLREDKVWGDRKVSFQKSSGSRVGFNVSICVTGLREAAGLSENEVRTFKIPFLYNQENNARSILIAVNEENEIHSKKESNPA